MVSVLQKARYEYKPSVPPVLDGAFDIEEVASGAAADGVPEADAAALKAIFSKTYGKKAVVFKKAASGKGVHSDKPLTMGIILSGGQAPGGHNVIAGLFDALKKDNPASRLLGFKGGPAGLVDCDYIELTAAFVNEYRNTGGFDMIGSGRTKIETSEQFAASLETAKKLNLDAVVVIGGDDSNTNAALLAEYFAEKGSPARVVGCPKTIDGDLKNAHIEASFGFDTACKTYSELIGNIERDANSAKKYWHFIKLMGRSASHIALECALQTRPNVCLISEEAAAKNLSLAQIVEEVCASIVKRAQNGNNFGVVLIPEGLVEFVPDVKALIQELNDVLSKHEKDFAALTAFPAQSDFLKKHLTPSSYAVFAELPEEIARQLLLDRDPHGNVQVSRIETEKLIMEKAEKRLAALKKEGKYNGKFSGLTHFFGYEGRCAFPSNFDADYCYSLGRTAYALAAAGLSGYIASVHNIAKPASEWSAGGAPLVNLMNIEQRKGEKKPVIKKALVELDGAPFKAFAKERAAWAVETAFVYPGAIQYYGPAEVANQPTITLKLEQG